MAGVRSVTASVKQLRAEGRLQLRDVAELRARPRDPEITWLLHDSGLVGVAEAWRHTDQRYLDTLARDHCLAATPVARGLVAAAVEEEELAGTVARLVAACLDQLTPASSLGWLGGVAERAGLLQLVTRHAPGPSLAQALAQHLQWPAEDADPGAGLGSLCAGLLAALGGPAVVRGVARTLARADTRPHWRHVLALVTVARDTCPDTVQLWRDLVADLVTRALEEESEEELRAGLLLARHLTLATTASSYTAWLTDTFAEDSPVLAGAGRRGAHLVVDTVSRLAATDPAPVLRAQLASRPGGLVRQCGAGWEVARQLARSRLDTEAGAEAAATMSAEISPATAATVRGYVEEWAGAGRVPGQLLEDAMFRQPLYEAQLLPALLSLQLDSPLEAARAGLVAALHARGKVTAGQLAEFRAGRYARPAQLQLASVPVSPEDCTEATLAQLLGVAAVLGPGDAEQLQQLAGRLATVARALVRAEAGVRVTLQAVLATPSNTAQLTQRVHAAILATVTRPELRHSSPLLQLLVCAPALQLLTLRHLLLHPAPTEAEVSVARMMVEAGQDTLELEAGAGTRLAEVLCSRHHSVTSPAQLEGVARLLSAVLPESSVRRMYLEDREQLLQCPRHSYSGRSLADLCAVLEMEMSIEAGERRPCVAGDGDALVETIMAMFGEDVIDEVTDLSTLLDHLVAVWRCQRMRSEENSTEAVVPPVLRGVLHALYLVTPDTWQEVYSACGARHEDTWVAVWSLLPELGLQPGQLQQLVRDTRRDTQLALPLAATKLAIRAVEAGAEPCAVTRASVGYWYARGRLTMGRWDEGVRSILTYGDNRCRDHFDPTFEAFRASRFGEPNTSRFIVVLLAERHLAGEDVTESDNSLRKWKQPLVHKLMRMLQFHRDRVEASLAAPPGDWWPGVVSPRLETACRVVLVLVLPRLAPAQLSPRFTVATLLRHLSSLLSCPATADWDLSEAVAGLLAMVRTLPRHEVTAELRAATFPLQQDLKAVLNSYM